MENLRKKLEIMREFGVKRLMYDGVDIELFEHGSPKAVQAEPERSVPEGMCVCGHPIVSEHSSMGCLHGCAVATCEAALNKEPKEQ